MGELSSLAHAETGDSWKVSSLAVSWRTVVPGWVEGCFLEEAFCTKLLGHPTTLEIVLLLFSVPCLLATMWPGTAETVPLRGGPQGLRSS
jgi:hypothetical protein